MAGPSAGDAGAGDRRPGRWLAWLAASLVVLGAFGVLDWAFFFIDRSRNPDERMLILRVSVLPFTATLCQPVVGLALLCWRRPPGFYIAFCLLCLIPVARISQHLLFDRLTRDLTDALLELLSIVNQSGLAQNAACLAFLLGVPAIQRAYGLTPAADRTTGDRAGGDRADSDHPQSYAPWRRPSWLDLLCLFLMLPLFCVVVTPGTDVADSVTYWTGWHMLRQAIRLAFAIPPMMAAALLFKYRRRSSLQFTIAVLWITGVAWRLLQLVPSVFPGNRASSIAWRYVVGFPVHVGFDLVMAFAWTAYLLNAPRIQALYPAVPAPRQQTEGCAR